MTEPRDRLEAAVGLALWVVLVAGWAVAVFYMWGALTTVPSAERLAESRLAEIPTPRMFVTATIFSAMELAVVLALTWPGRLAYFATRLAIGVLALITWFIMTTPMRELSRMDWVHRRWLAFMVLALGAALAVLLAYRGAVRLLGRQAA